MLWRLLGLLLTLRLVTPSWAQAQDVVGFRFGLNVSDIGGDIAPSDEIGKRTGFVVGLFGTVPLRHGFEIQPELLYLQKGLTSRGATIRDEGGMSLGSLAIRVELTYLEVPLFLKYRLPVGEVPLLALYAGPTISFELAERLVVDGLQGSQESDQFRSPDFGGALGVDLEVALFGVQGLLGVRYSQGLGNVIENQFEGVADRNVYNRSISLLLGLHLR